MKRIPRQFLHKPLPTPEYGIATLVDEKMRHPGLSGMPVVCAWYEAIPMLSFESRSLLVGRILHNQIG